MKLIGFFSKKTGGQFQPKLDGHFQLELGGQFKTKNGGQYSRYLHILVYNKSDINGSLDSFIFGLCRIGYFRLQIFHQGS